MCGVTAEGYCLVLPGGGGWGRLGAVVAAATLQVVGCIVVGQLQLLSLCMRLCAEALSPPRALQQRLGDRLSLYSLCCVGLCTYCELFVCLGIA